MSKKITFTKLIWTLICMVFLMLVLSQFFKYLFLAINVSEPYATLLGLAIGLIVPGVGEIATIIIPYVKQMQTGK